MKWYSLKTFNEYYIYLSDNGIGIYIKYNIHKKITQIFITDKLYSMKESERLNKIPDESEKENIWDQIIKHPEWDKMLIEQVFNL